MPPLPERGDVLTASLVLDLPALVMCVAFRATLPLRMLMLDPAAGPVGPLASLDSEIYVERKVSPFLNGSFMVVAVIVVGTASIAQTQT